MSANTPSQPSNAKAWTIMAYLAGDNNLAEECVYSLTEMKAANPDARIKVVAQFDPTGRQKRTQRFVINQNLEDSNGQPKARATDKPDGSGKHRRKITEDVVLDAHGQPALPEGTVTFPVGGRPVKATVATAPGEEGETDSGDPKTLFDFISWTVEHHPADHYMVVLSGHGSGANEQEFLRDDSSHGTLTIKEMAEVFEAVRDNLKDKNGKPLLIDIVGMDSCLMSMAEVCHELAGKVRYMISSESFGPRSGWPYGRILEELSEDLKNGKNSAEDLGQLVVKQHVDFYLEYAVTNGLSVDISLMDVSQATKLREAVKPLADTLVLALKAGQRHKQNNGSSGLIDQLVLAHWEAQSYNGELYVDLRDFCTCLSDRYRAGTIFAIPVEAQSADVKEEIKLRTDVGNACTALIDLIRDALVKKSCYMGVTFQYSFGVSIYFPWAEVAPDYNKDQLTFLINSGWREFLEAYVEGTRREPRGFRQGGDSVITLDKKVRKTPLDQKGPENILIRSMRNPPVQVITGGLSVCTPKDAFTR